MSRLCLVEDDPIMGESLAERFRLEKIDACWVRSAESAEEILLAEDFSVVVCDIRLPGLSGDRLFERLRARRAVVPPFVFITGHADLERAVELLKEGAADYLAKPFDLDHLLARIRELIGDAEGSAGAPPPLGVSPTMQRLDMLLARIAPLDSTVLVTGETGTGKEVIARRLHELSGRGPFVAVNCAALVETLAESELFGHERGSFTGAARTHAGVFERAKGGTLFLDEIGDMPLALQAKLLRVIQDRAVVRVGGKEPVPVDARLVLATHQDLKRLVREGRFREDLYFRIDVVELHLPPLRERRADIPWLARCFLDECAGRRGGRPLSLTPDAEQALVERDWPGNVRELRHRLERACIFADGDRLRAVDLFGGALEAGGPEDSATGRPAPRSAPQTGAHGQQPMPGDPRDNESLESYLAECERRYIERTLEVNAGRVGQTAERLGISRKSLWERMRRLGIRKDREGQDP